MTAFRLAPPRPGSPPNRTRIQPLRLPNHATLARRLLGSCALLISLSTLADEASEPCNLLAATQALAEQLNTALQQESRCRKNPAFLHHLGRLLNQAQRYAEAIDRFEAALMYQPDAWPTRLEYAIALAGIGDYRSSSSLLNELKSNPAVAPATRQEIDQLLARKTSANKPPSLLIGLAAGHDNNLFGSADQGKFDLTFPTGRLPVEISADQHPQAGSFIRADLRLEAPLSQDASSRWDYSLLGSYRWSTENAAANLAHWGISLERRSTQPSGPYMQALFQQLHQQGGSTLNQSQVALGLDFPAALLNQSCRYRTGAEFHYTAYTTAATLNGYYSGLLAQIACPSSNLRIQLRLGQDTPEHTQRAGGTQTQALIRLAKNIAIKQAILAAEVEYFLQNDRAGYSPLLENNARRQLQRTTYRFEYRWSWQRYSPYIGVEWLDQRANLPLFGVQNRVLTLGLRSAW